jgi:tetratricopeptide (TPR) repeat protein
MSTRAIAAVVVLGLVSLFSLPARAEDPKRAAKKLLGQGDKLFKKGDYEGALASYQKAFDTFPSAKIYYPMALTEEKLGRDIDALGHYELLLSEAGEEIPDELKQDATTRIAEIEKRIVIIRFDVRPLGATITVDNVELGQAPLDRPVRLMPGMHSWAIAKDGFLPLEKEMELEGGTHIDEEIQLEPDQPITIAPNLGPRPEKKKDVSRAGESERMVFIGGVVVSSALLTAAIVTGLFALSEHSDFEDTKLPTADREAARDAGEAMAVTTDVLLLAAVATGAFTTWWYLKKYRPAMNAAEDRPPPPDETGAVIMPYATGDGAGFAVTGRW